MSRPCVHKWQIDSKNVGTCSLCGEVRQFPYEKGQEPVVLKAGRPGHRRARKKRAGVRAAMYERAKYHQDNKEAIIADILSIGRVPTSKKWNIPTSTIHTLAHKWLTPEQKASPQSLRYPTPLPSSAGAEPQNGRLPPFPPFSDKWQPEVQLQWLEVYEILATQVHKA